MPRTPEGAVAWTRDPANRNRHQGGNWHNMCQQYVNNAGDFNSSFDTAWLAGQHSGPLRPSLEGIQDGAIGYWRGVWIEGEECGHDAIWHNGAWWMASDACGEARPGKGERIGNGTGWITHEEYARLRPAAIWQGWSMRHGNETLARSTTTATTGHTPLPPMREKPNMWVTWSTDGTGWVVTGLGCHGLPSMQVYNLFARLIKATPEKPDSFLRAEMDIMNAQLRIIAVAAQNKTEIDADKLASALSDALGKKLTVDAVIDPKELSAAFAGAADRVAAAIVKQAGIKLAS